MKKILGLSLLLAVTMVNAEVIEQICKGCHGKNYEKKAFAKTAILKDMDKEEIFHKLKGYREGTLSQYSLGEVMQHEVKNYSDSELKEFAEKYGR